MQLICSARAKRRDAVPLEATAVSKKMFNGISEFSKSDERLSELFEQAQGYADIYMLAAKRQKGCDGMGEIAMIREEFAESLAHLIKYCIDKGYLPCNAGSDIDSAADELAGAIKPL